VRAAKKKRKEKEEAEVSTRFEGGKKKEFYQVALDELGKVSAIDIDCRAPRERVPQRGKKGKKGRWGTEKKGEKHLISSDRARTNCCSDIGLP